VRVLTVREILAHGVDEHMGARVALEDLAMATLTYQVGSPGVEGVVGSRGAAVRCRGCVGDDEAAVVRVACWPLVKVWLPPRRGKGARGRCFGASALLLRAGNAPRSPCMRAATSIVVAA
jgi:hypothetical protein